MVSLSTSILVLFAASCLFAFFFPFVKEGVMKRLSTADLWPGARLLGIALLPFIVMLVIFEQLGTFKTAATVAFAASMALSYVLARLKLPEVLRGIVLLVCAVVFTTTTPTEAIAAPLSAALLGLLVWKAVENFMLAESSTFDDVLPAAVWLVAVMWNRSVTPENMMALREGVVLAAISIAMALRIVQRPFLNDDKWLVKRVVLSATGGLVFLIVVQKLLLAVHLGSLALLYGGALFGTYLFMSFPHKEEREARLEKEAEVAIERNGMRSIGLLVVIGGITLLAMRFFGIFGLVTLAPAALIAPSGFAQCIGIYAISRALLQVFIYSFNSNITGINVMHTYSSAAQYAGFTAVVILFVLMQQVHKKGLLAVLFLAACVGLPIASNFFIHAEPTASLLLSLTIAAPILAIFAPALRKSETGALENLMLLPLMSIAAAILTGSFIDTGNGATIGERGTLIGSLIAAIVIVSVARCFLTKGCRATQP